MLPKIPIPKFFKDIGLQIPILLGVHFILIVGILSFALIKGYQISNTRTIEYATLLNDIVVYQEKQNIETARVVLKTWNTNIYLSPSGTDYCDIFEENLLNKVLGETQIVSYGTVSPENIIECSPAKPELVGTKGLERQYISDAIKSKSLERSDYQIGQASGIATTAFAYPVLNTDGSIRTVLILSVGLSWMKDVIAELPVPLNSEILRLDNEGKILAKVPEGLDSVGELGLPEKTFDYISKTRFGYFDGQGRDRIRRTYVYSPIYVEGEDTPDTYIVVGIPKDTFLDDVNNLRDKIMMLIGFTFLIEFIIVTLFTRAIHNTSYSTYKNKRSK